jgi:hypothetical protein
VSELAAAAWVSVPTSADADTNTARRARLVSLRGPATETCPPESDLRDAVAARLGYDPFFTWARDTLFVEVAAEPPGGFVARVKLVDGDNTVRGERELHARKACADLVPALALTISLAIDPTAGEGKAPPPDAPPRERPVDLDASTEATVPSPPPDVPSVEPTPAEPAGLRWALGVGMLGALGAAPAANVGLSVFGEARYRWASVGSGPASNVARPVSTEPASPQPPTATFRTLAKKRTKAARPTLAIPRLGTSRAVSSFN